MGTNTCGGPSQTRLSKAHVLVRRDGEKHYTQQTAAYMKRTLRSTSKINLGSVGKPAELITKMLRQATTRAVRFIIRNRRIISKPQIWRRVYPVRDCFQGRHRVVGGENGSRGSSKLAEHRVFLP